MNSKDRSGKIRVFMVDRNAFFRQGVRVTLAGHPEMEIIGECDVIEGAFELIYAASPHVVLVDVTPPSFAGIELTRRIAQTLPDTEVAVMAPYPNEDELVMAATAGAAAYLSRYIGPAELIHTIERLADGELLLVESLLAKPHLLERVLRSFRDLSLKGRAIDPANAPITERETEILSYVARGYGNKQIAHILNISEQTIKNHMTSILRKLDASDRTHAVVMAMQSGWISVTEKYDPGRGRQLA